MTIACQLLIGHGCYHADLRAVLIFSVNLFLILKNRGLRIVGYYYVSYVVVKYCLGTILQSTWTETNLLPTPAPVKVKCSL